MAILLAPVPPTPPTKSSFYRPELDVLRFFAFFAVFLHHSVNNSAEYFSHHHVPQLLANGIRGVVLAGQYGVSLFFVLSSYLITELLIREKEQTGSLDVKSFYLRRILRIWPLYYFFLLLTIVVPWFDPKHEFGIRYILPFVFLAGNWSFVRFGWPDQAAIIPLWSVSVEEQFYLLWPPLVARLTLKRIVYAALVMILLANASRIILVLLGSTQLWPNTFAHMDSIAAGILLAVLLHHCLPTIRFMTRCAMIIGGIACISLRGYFEILLPPNSRSWGDTLLGWPAVAASSAAILYAFIGLRIRVRWLQYLGKISYGLYVYHFVCLSIAGKLVTFRPGLIHIGLYNLTALGLTIAISAVSYVVLETPFLNLKRRFTHVRSRPV